MSNTSYLVTQDATGTAYDNSTSGLTATDVQAAIDEVAGSSGGGGSAWELVSETDLTTAGNPTSIEYTGLAAGYVYRVRFHDMSTATASSTYLTLAYSTNNGSTWLEAGANDYGHYIDYVAVSGGSSSSEGAAQEAVLLGYSMSMYNGNRTHGTIELHDINSSTGKPHTMVRAWSNDRLSARGSTDYKPTLNTQVNAIKLDFLNGAGFGSTGKIALERVAI